VKAAPDLSAIAEQLAAIQRELGRRILSEEIDSGEGFGLVYFVQCLPTALGKVVAPAWQRSTARVLGPYAQRDKWRVVVIDPGGSRSSRIIATEAKAERHVEILRADFEREHGPIKIGMSVDVASRMLAIQTAMPFDLRLRAVVPTWRMERVEQSMHHVLRGHRLRGEWFECASLVECAIDTANRLTREWLRGSRVDAGEQLMAEMQGAVR
jgi:hypothetical protein